MVEDGADRAADGGERGAQIVGDGAEQGVAQPLGFGLDLSGLGLLGQARRSIARAVWLAKVSSSCSRSGASNSWGQGGRTPRTPTGPRGAMRGT